MCASHQSSYDLLILCERRKIVWANYNAPIHNIDHDSTSHLKREDGEFTEFSRIENYSTYEFVRVRWRCHRRPTTALCLLSWPVCDGVCELVTASRIRIILAVVDRHRDFVSVSSVKSWAERTHADWLIINDEQSSTGYFRPVLRRFRIIRAYVIHVHTTNVRVQGK